VGLRDDQFPVIAHQLNKGQSPSSTFHPQLGNPKSVYIHIPFCRHRCGYCNFTLVAGRDYLIDRFLDALEIEISWIDQTYLIDTLFLGGGTPSHLSPQQLGRLAEIIGSRFVFSSTAEVTAECNPNDLDNQRLNALKDMRVNRISLGVQSLNEAKLKRLERDHCETDIRRAVSSAKKLGLDISLDMIFAAPQETLANWQTDLNQAISLQPDHMSTYELTYEKGTQFWNRLNRGNVNEADEDLRAEMYAFAINRLNESGMNQYEVSSFARTSKTCRHNLAYWQGDPFFAFGPGAARFVDGIRETNHRSTTHYLKLIHSGQSPVAERELLAPEPAARERLAIGLRMTKGIDENNFLERTGYSVASILKDFQQTLMKNGLLRHEGSQFRLTEHGIMLCDWIAAEIVNLQKRKPQS
jgi:oxygen-independent coproporphyrinogen-3 oxidase